MTELALTFGIDPGTVWVGKESSSDSCDLVARWVRRGRGVALASESESAVDFDFERCRCAGTPLGLTSFGFSWSGEIGVSAATHVNASRIAAKQKSKRRFTGGKLPIKIQSTQAAVTNLRPAESIRFRSLPGRR